MPTLEIGDMVFEDWYGASGYFGSCLDNGGGAALVCGPAIVDWRGLDLPNARLALSLNGTFVKDGFGRAAMGHPLTSLTWLVNWLSEQRSRDRGRRDRQHRYVHRPLLRRGRGRGLSRLSGSRYCRGAIRSVKRTV